MTDFWISCGHHLLDRDEGGGLMVTDDFLKVYLARPELIPPPEACVVERTLHGALLANPRHEVSASDIAAIADADARENWQLLIEFRDHLLRHKTLEAAYVELARDGGSGNFRCCSSTSWCTSSCAMRSTASPTCACLRAAELFFRTQRVTLHDGSLIAADEETIGGINTAPTSPLVSMLGLPAESAIDVLNNDNSDSYWERSDQFDMALDLTAGREGLEALAEAMRLWIAHVLGIEVEIEPLKEMRDVNLAWYVGLDADATKIGDMLWNGEEIDEATMERTVGLFRLTFEDPGEMIDEVKGEPVYMILAMTRGQADPHEAAESGHRPADPASGGDRLKRLYCARDDNDPREIRMRDEGLSEAIRAAGGVSELARQIGISQPSVSNWVRVPAERVISIEAATGVDRSILRPDLYGGESGSGVVDDIDTARAQEYALIAALLTRAPDAKLLADLATLHGDPTARHRPYRRSPKPPAQPRSRASSANISTCSSASAAANCCLMPPIILPAFCRSARWRGCATISPRSALRAPTAWSSRKITPVSCARSCRGWPAAGCRRRPIPTS